MNSKALQDKVPSTSQSKLRFASQHSHPDSGEASALHKAASKFHASHHDAVPQFQLGGGSSSGSGGALQKRHLIDQQLNMAGTGQGNTDSKAGLQKGFTFGGAKLGQGISQGVKSQIYQRDSLNNAHMMSEERVTEARLSKDEEGQGSSTLMQETLSHSLQGQQVSTCANTEEEAGLLKVIPSAHSKLNTTTSTSANNHGASLLNFSTSTINNHHQEGQFFLAATHAETQTDVQPDLSLTVPKPHWLEQ